MTTTEPSAACTPSFDASHEVRFAVVIYGGVSLAVYINGIVQEMLRLVRATAPDPLQADRLRVPQAVGSEKVYRRLAQLVGGADDDQTPTGILRRAALPADGADAVPVRARFVIDVLSGTSAGGINAVFLAKALANEQSLESLERVWIDQGNIQLLINDDKSVGDLKNRIGYQLPPTSLLNGQRMYLQLLDALDLMDKATPKRPALVDRLDLFCTATDLEGLRAPLPLADSLADERRHRSVFRFRHAMRDGGVARSDFSSRENPFLAFAARCTSSFPFAFEPMCLDDVFPVLAATAVHREKPYVFPDTSEWARFYPSYALDPERSFLSFSKRPFGDGGYLDNKPFSYAIDTVLNTDRGPNVRRKLVYIEPNPEHLARASTVRPDAIKNSLDALLVLPRDETIREDLERVLLRNAELTRFKRVLAVLDGVAAVATSGPTAGGNPDVWRNLNHTEMLRGFGPAYIAYQRLKLSEVTDQLTNLIAKQFGIEGESAYWRAVRILTGVWRDEAYREPSREAQFLLDFDLGYRLRRLRYLIGELPALQLVASDDADYSSELRQAGRALRASYNHLLELLDSEKPLAADTQLPVTPEQLEFILTPPETRDESKLAAEGYAAGDAGATARAHYILAKERSQIDAFAEKIRETLSAAIETVSFRTWDRTKGTFELKAGWQFGPAYKAGAARARKALVEKHDHFEARDAIVFPVTFGTVSALGEPIDIHRISPDDTTARSAERLAGPKLKGQALGAFGAFLDQSWRCHDILWGRLDGAERLVEIVLPGSEPALQRLRSELIDEAHRAIVLEFLEMHAASWLSKRRQAGSAPPSFQVLLKDYLNEAVQENPTAELVARSAARSTYVTGQVLQAAFSKFPWTQKPLSWLARLGLLGWGFVEVAVPRSPWELMHNYWFKLTLFLCAVTLGMGVVAGSTALWVFGGVVFVLALLAEAVVAVLGRYLRGLTVLTVGALAGSGIVFGLLLALLLGLALSRAPAIVAPWDTLPHGRLVRSAWRALGAVNLGFLITTLVLGLRHLAASGSSRAALRALQSAKTFDQLREAVGFPGHPKWQGSQRALRGGFPFIGGYAFLFVAAAVPACLALHASAIALAGFGVSIAAIDMTRRNALLGVLAEPLTKDRAPFVVIRRASRLTKVLWLVVIAAVAFAAVVGWLALAT